MRRYVLALIAVVSVCLVLSGARNAAAASEGANDEAHGLALSSMKVSITSQGRTATFRLYDTAAAKEF